MMRRLAQTVTTKEQLAELVEAYSRFDRFVFDLETMGGAPDRDGLHTPTNRVFWIGLAGPGRCDAIPMGHPHGRLLEAKHQESYLPPESERRVLANGSLSMAKKKRTVPDRFAPPPPQLTREIVLPALQPLFFSDRIKINQNVKFDIKTLSKYYPSPIPGPVRDVQVSAHILDENRKQYALGVVVKDRLGYSYEKLGSKGVENFAFDVAARYAMYDARTTWLLDELEMGEIDAQGFTTLLEFESKVTGALLEMELAGIPIDFAAMEELGVRLDKDMKDLADVVYSAAGYEFNMNANAEKAKFVYEVRKHPVRKRTKQTKEPSTDKEALEYFADRDPAVQAMLDHAKLGTIRSTFVGGLTPYIHEGILYPQFNQHRTVTGRLSASAPNTQNIPRYDPDEPDSAASAIRKLFVAPPGHQLVVADYDQIELRVMALFSRDPIMLATFQDPTSDIHRASAAAALDKDPKDITREERQLGKAFNFALGYGAGPAKVSAMTGLPLNRSKVLLAEFKAKYSGVYAWQAAVINEARARNPRHVETLCGRWRRLPDLVPNPQFYRDEKKRWQVKSYAERQAVNTVVQGSAADLMKMALIRLQKRFKGTPFKMALTIHDEIVSIAPTKLAEECQTLVVDAMGGIDWLEDVPLLVSSGIATSWNEAK